MPGLALGVIRGAPSMPMRAPKSETLSQVCTVGTSLASQALALVRGLGKD